MEKSQSAQRGGKNLGRLLWLNLVAVSMEMVRVLCMAGKNLGRLL